MTSLRGSGGSGDGGGSSNGSGGGRSSRSYGAVRWGVSGGGQLQLQRRQHDTLSPQQLREWYAHRSGGGGSSGSCCATVQLEVSSGGLAQLQRRPRETLTPQQLREWYTLHEVSRSSARCSSVIRTGDRAGQTCGTIGHTQSRCFFCLSDTWRAEFGDAAELPRWQELLSQGVDIFALYYDALLAVMYAVTIGTEGDCSLCVLPDPGIEAAALGASESALIGTAPAEALHTFTLDSGASRCFFATSPSSLLSLHLYRSDWLTPKGAQFLPVPPLFSLVRRTADLQDAMVTTTTPGDQRVSIRTCTRTGRHLATFTRQPGSSLYTLATEPPQVAASAQDEIHNVLIPWIRAVRLQLRERFRQDLPVLRLHSDRGGEFSSDLLRDFCRGEGILQSFALPASPQQNGIAERRIGLVMEVARTSMIHAAAPHFLWPFAIWYATLQLNLWPRVSLPETSPTLRWTGKVGDASVFRFYHPTSRRAFPSHDVAFDESVPLYRLFLYRSAPPPPPPLFLAPGPPSVDPLPPKGLVPSGVSQVDPLPGIVPVEVAVASSAARGAAFGAVELGGAEFEGVGSGGAEPGGAEPGGAEPAGMEPGGAASEGAESGGAERRAAGAGDSAAGDTGAGGAGVTAGAGGTGGVAAAGPGGARTRGTGAAGTAGGTSAGGAGGGGAGAGDTGAVDPGAGGVGVGGAVSGGISARDIVRSRPYFVPLLPSSTGLPPRLPKRCEPESRLALPVRAVRTGRRVPCPLPPPVPGTHAMALRPSSVPLRVPVPAPPDSSLPAVPDPESDLACAACPTISRLLATVVTDPSFESTAASALVAELVDFAVACRLDYATALVAESDYASPSSIGGNCALGTDVLDNRQEDFECLAAAVPCFASMLLAPEGDPDAPDIPTPRSYIEAITSPYSSQWQATMDAEMASWKSTGTYVDAFPPSRANIVDGMWIFRVKRPPGSQPTFKARYVARGFSQRQGVDYFQTFSPTPKMTTLRVLLHVAAQRDYELHSLDFSTPFSQGSLHEEI
ncbi:unnamed protein product [Closterium sp. NIES-54]